METLNRFPKGKPVYFRLNWFTIMVGQDIEYFVIVWLEAITFIQSAIKFLTIEESF